MSRRLLNRLYYFTVEDEGLLGEAFPKFESEGVFIAYKVVDTDDVFVTTAETKEAMDRQDLQYNLLAEEEAAQLLLSIRSRPVDQRWVRCNFWSGYLLNESDYWTDWRMVSPANQLGASGHGI